jgi:hypothetical protein
MNENIIQSTDGTRIACSVCGKECQSVYRGDCGMYLCEDHRNYMRYSV